MDSDVVYGDDAEASLRIHVRSILDDYVLEHLTIDQVQYTSDSVSEVCIIYYEVLISNDTP